ncbi:MAG: hypothetical protein IIC24_11440, partial [Chloroflexi bacterium]|nr:hypothetical protein [Chloroflexota bacterium]
MQSGGTNIPNVMLETSQALSEVDPEAHSRILTLSEGLLEESPAAVPEFIKSCAQIMDRLSLAQVERWF